MTQERNRFCSKCGAKLPTGAEFCPKCGKPVPKSTWRESRVTEANTNDKSIIEQSDETNNNSASKVKSGPVGVGGWLTLFLITVLGTVAALVFDIIQTVPNLNGDNAVFLLPIVAMELAIVVFALIILFKLSSQKKIVVRYVKIYLILAISQGAYVLFLLQLYKSLGSLGSDVESQMFSLGIRNIFFALVWLLYFYNSKRVKNTFIK